jgi:host factor-I protein
MSAENSVQEQFLNMLCQERVPVSIFLVNGIRLQGTIASFDQYSLILQDAQHNSQLVLKRHISTVSQMQAPGHHHR